MRISVEMEFHAYMGRLGGRAIRRALIVRLAWLASAGLLQARAVARGDDRELPDVLTVQHVLCRKRSTDMSLSTRWPAVVIDAET